jgi:hypothetical protein
MISIVILHVICYNTYILARRLTKNAVKQRKIDIFIFPFLQTAYAPRPEGQATGSEDPVN